MQNFIRVNEILDIYIHAKKKTISIFLLPTREWYYPKDDADLVDYVLNQLAFYEENPGLIAGLAAYMDEESIIHFGKYRGKKLSEVPAGYLIWILENANVQPDLKAYILKNEDRLREKATPLKTRRYARKS